MLHNHVSTEAQKQTNTGYKYSLLWGVFVTFVTSVGSHLEAEGDGKGIHLVAISLLDATTS